MDKIRPTSKMRIPKELGAAIDHLFKVREGRREMQKEVDAIKAQENEIENIIFERFGKSDLEGARGKLAQCSIKRSEVANIDDWESFEKYVKKTGELDLFQRRISLEAIRERWAEGRVVPGVAKFTKISLSLTARK